MYRIDPEGKGYVSYHDFLESFESREGRVRFDISFVFSAVLSSDCDLMKTFVLASFLRVFLILNSKFTKF